MLSLANLLPSLIEATESKKLKWQARKFSGFETTLDGLSLSTWTWTDPNADDISGASLVLMDGPETLDEIVVNEYDGRYDRIRSIFLAARRSAKNVDSIIEKLEESLKRL